MQTWIKLAGGAIVFGGIVLIILAPIVGEKLFDSLWGVEPLSFIGAILLVAGLGVISVTYIIPQVIGRWGSGSAARSTIDQRWSQLTQQYFQLFDHDLGRPLRRILGKERELRAVLHSSGGLGGADVKELLDEIERQAPNFRLMLSNIQVLVQLEAAESWNRRQAMEPTEVVRRIVDRYTPVAKESHKEITWWAEPSEFGIVYSDTSAVEHIVVNLVDNAVRFAATHIEVKITKTPSHFFVRVWDDGPGIAPQYQQHIFDHGWTPQVATREEKSSSGLGLFIARTLAARGGGDVSVESVPAPDKDNHTAFLLSLPLSERE